MITDYLEREEMELKNIHHLVINCTEDKTKYLSNCSGSIIIIIIIFINIVQCIVVFISNNLKMIIKIA